MTRTRFLSREMSFETLKPGDLIVFFNGTFLLITDIGDSPSLPASLRERNYISASYLFLGKNGSTLRTVHASGFRTLKSVVWSMYNPEIRHVIRSM